MVYSRDKDKVIWDNSIIIDKNIITVAVCSYDGGPKKVKLLREILDKDNKERFAKLGRFTVDEVKGLIPLLEEAKRVMESEEKV